MHLNRHPTPNTLVLIASEHSRAAMCTPKCARLSSPTPGLPPARFLCATMPRHGAESGQREVEKGWQDSVAPVAAKLTEQHGSEISIEVAQAMLDRRQMSAAEWLAWAAERAAEAAAYVPRPPPDPENEPEL